MSRRLWITAVLVAVTEGYLHVRYAALGAQFHFWLHGLVGAALGVSALTAVRAVRAFRGGRDSTRGALAPWEAGLA